MDGQSAILPIDAIIELPESQRKSFSGIEELAGSLASVGLIHAIRVTPEGVLVVGRRRLRAAKHLGWTHINVVYTDELEPERFREIELEENVKRSELTWKEHVMAVTEYHELRLATDPEWSQLDTARRLSVDPMFVSRNLAVARELRAGTELVCEASGFTVAVNICQRLEQRRQDADKDLLNAAFDSMVNKAAAPAALSPANVLKGRVAAATEKAMAEKLAERPAAPASDAVAAPLHNIDFTDFAREYSGPKFNLLHCDFPYGINADKGAGIASGVFGGYADSRDVYFDLLELLEQSMDKLVAPNAHLMFWFSPKYYLETKVILERMGWKLDYYPLIWFRSDNSGVAPDPQRGPRYVYEMCFFGTRGERKIVQTVANTFAAPNKKEFHMSEKPKEMLAHFFRMLVDDTTVMLDPTAGSGNAVIEATRAGARHVVGLERDPGFHAESLVNWRKSFE